MGRICDISKNNRPREKALRIGIDKLSDYELLAIIIGSGTKNHSAIDISCDLINSYNGINNLIHCDYKKFIKFKGVSIIKSLQLMACFEFIKRYYNAIIVDEMICSKELEDILIKYCLMHKLDDKEHFYIIGLDKKMDIILENEFYIGTKNKILISIDEIMHFLKENNINYFCIVHNHPNHSHCLSDYDIILTNELLKRCKKEKMHLVNHYILTDNKIASVLKTSSSKNYLTYI